MKYLPLFAVTMSALLFSCGGNAKTATADSTAHGDTLIKTSIATADTSKHSYPAVDKAEIRVLIIKMLKWSEKNAATIDLLPGVTKDTVYTSFDLAKAEQTASQLKATGFFSEEFIGNYKKIIKTLDEQVRSGKYEKWLVNELPPFTFANDVDPWCSCQDNFPWDDVNIAVIKFDSTKGDLKWGWGKPDADPKWKETSKTFRVTKDGGKWKISYLDGFDYKTGTQMLQASH